MKRLAAFYVFCAGLTITALACAGAFQGGVINVSKPPQIQVYSFGVVACGVPVAVEASCSAPIAGATIEIHEASDYAATKTNADGYALLTSLIPFSDLKITADGFAPFAVGLEPPKITGKNLSFSLTALHRNAGERGRVHVDGLVFRREDGSIFPWRGFSDFRLFERFLNGEDLDALLDERAAVGANVLRVFGMYDGGIGRLHPQEHTDYPEKLRAFADLLAGRGLRFELVIFADAQVVMPQLAAMQTHEDLVVRALADKWNAFVEVCNEPFKNGCDVGVLVPPVVGVPRSSGDYTWPPITPVLELDYGTLHPERKPEWPRTAKDLLDFREQSPRPWVADEPMGAAEVDQPGRRSAVPEDFAAFGATAALMGAGATYHCDACIQSQRLGPVQMSCAKAFFEGLKFVPPEAQLWPYQRGDQANAAGVGNMPIAHDDARSLRTFCKGTSADEWCVAIRPTTTWQAIPRAGWRIESEPSRGLVHLVRS